MLAVRVAESLEGPANGRFSSTTGTYSPTSNKPLSVSTSSTPSFFCTSEKLFGYNTHAAVELALTAAAAIAKPLSDS